MNGISINGKPLRVVVIDVDGTCEVRELDGSLASFQACVGGGYLELVRLALFPGLDVFINEEGRLREFPPHALFPSLVGPVAVTRSDRHGGSVTLTDEDVAQVLAAARYAQMNDASTCL